MFNNLFIFKEQTRKLSVGERWGSWESPAGSRGRAQWRPEAEPW